VLAYPSEELPKFRMKFVCEGCNTRYSIADEKVRQKILRIRCKTCGEVIVVHEAKGGDSSLRRAPAAAPRGLGKAPPPPPPPAWPQATIAEWYVSVNGQRHGPFTRTDAARHVLTTSESDDVHVWKDGMTGWKPAREVSVIAREIAILRPPASPPPPPPPPPKKPAAGAKTPPPSAKASSITLPFEEELTIPNSSQVLPESDDVAAVSASALPKVGTTPPPSTSASAMATPGTPSPRTSAAVLAKLATTPSPRSSTSLPKAGVTPSPRSSTSLPKAGVTPSPRSSTSLPKAGVTPSPRASATALPKLALTPAPRASSTSLPQAPLTPSPAMVSPGVESVKVARAGSISLPVPPPPGQVPTMPTSREEDLFADLSLDENLEGPPEEGPNPAGLPLMPATAATSGTAAAAATSATLPVPLALPAPTTLFPVTVSSPVTMPHAHAESGLSRLTGLAALAHRHQGMKYIIAGAAIVVLVIVLVILSLRGEGGKKGAPLAKAVSTENKSGKSEAELAKELEAAVGKVPDPEPREDNPSATKVNIAPKPHVGKTPARPTPPTVVAVTSKPTPTPAQAAAVKRMQGSSGTGKNLAPARPNPFASNAKPITAEQVMAVVRRNQGSVKICYERALKLDNHLTKGRIDVTVSVGLSGTVRKVMLSTPPGFYVIVSCLKDAVRRMTFPANGEEYTMSFPLIMQGGM
jgi:predicted Zn finger-like uncharacterized protein